MSVENGISYWEQKFCKYCKVPLCKKTAQALASQMVGKDGKDYLSCMMGFQMAISLGDREIIREFRKKGKPPIEITGAK